MEIIVGKNSGFCYGVDRAVKNAKQAAKYEKLCCLGEIVHNQNVIKSLEDLGISFIDDIEQANSTTIIRAHGVQKEIYKIAKEKKIKLIDLTCLSVLKIHQIAQEYAEKGYFIIITGKEKHPEVVGIKSYAVPKYIVISSIEELNKNLDEIIKEKKILLISQTTFSSKKFEEISKLLRQSINSETKLVVKNTICNTTENRQLETEKIAKCVDNMIIIGDKRSSNSNELYKIAAKFCENTQFVSNKDELDLSHINKNSKIGIMAGASTPDEDVYEIKEKILSLDVGS